MTPRRGARARARHGRLRRRASAKTSSSARRTRAGASRRFSTRCSTRAIRAGATTLNIPDTVGYTTPDEFGRAHPRHPRERARRRRASSSRCTATTTSGWRRRTRSPGIRAGARQAEVTINGIGERAGNTSLEEVVMALATRAAQFELRTGIDTTQLVRLSRLVSAVHRAWSCQPNKAIVGRERVRARVGHPPGRDAQARRRPTRSCAPRASGSTQTRLVLGKHSGRARARARAWPSSGTASTTRRSTASSSASRRSPIGARPSTDADLEALVHDDAEAAGRALLARRAAGRAAGRRAWRRRPCGCGAPTARCACTPRSGPGRSTRAYKAIDAIVDAPAELARVLGARR